MNRVVYIKAYFKPVGKKITVNVPTGSKKKGLFGREKEITRKETQFQQTGWSDREIDGERLSNDIARAVSVLNEQGYEVVSLLPVISGNYNYQYQAQEITSKYQSFVKTEAVSGGASFGYGYGYSYTEGVSIVTRRML